MALPEASARVVEGAGDGSHELAVDRRVVFGCKGRCARAEYERARHSECSQRSCYVYVHDSFRVRSSNVHHFALQRLKTLAEAPTKTQGNVKNL